MSQQLCVPSRKNLANLRTKSSGRARPWPANPEIARRHSWRGKENRRKDVKASAPSSGIYGNHYQRSAARDDDGIMDPRQPVGGIPRASVFDGAREPRSRSQHGGPRSAGRWCVRRPPGARSTQGEGLHYMISCTIWSRQIHARSGPYSLVPSTVGGKAVPAVSVRRDGGLGVKRTAPTRCRKCAGVGLLISDQGYEAIAGRRHFEAGSPTLQRLVKESQLGLSVELDSIATEDDGAPPTAIAAE